MAKRPGQAFFGCGIRWRRLTVEAGALAEVTIEQFRDGRAVRRISSSWSARLTPYSTSTDTLSATHPDGARALIGRPAAAWAPTRRTLASRRARGGAKRRRARAR